MLQIDVAALLEKFEEEENAKKENELDDICQNLSLDEEDLDDGKMEISVEGSNQIITTNETQMWVDKYTSEKFFDLLTDEVVNRNVLTWLKSWDEIVFPEKAKISLKMPEGIKNQAGFQFKKDMTFRKVDA